MSFLFSHFHRALKTWLLAANELSAFKFEMDAEEKETRDSTPPLALRSTRFVCLLLRPPGIANGVLNVPYIALVWVLGPVVGCSDRGYRPRSNYFDPEKVVSII